MRQVCGIAVKTVIDKNVSGQWAINFSRVSCSRIERFVDHVYSFARKSSKMLLSLTF